MSSTGSRSELRSSVSSTTDEDIQELTAAVRNRCAAFDDNYWSRCDEEHRFPHEFYEALATDGWLGMTLPAQYGGAGLGIAPAAAMVREIAASGAAMNGCSPLHLNIFALRPVVEFGNDRLKSEFLPRAATGALKVAFGVTEPDAGTDTSQIRTTATRHEDGWVIDGQKIWTSNALEAQVVLVLARTSRDAASRFGGLSLFLADLDPTHVTIRAIPKLGRNAIASCEMFIDHLPVPDWRLVGTEGEGFRQLLTALNPERILLAAEAVGIGEVALHAAVAYANQRVVFGRHIGSNQSISHPLAVAHAQLQAAWRMVERAAARYDAGESSEDDIHVAKYLAAEAGFFAADRAVQTLGGLGYAREYHVERYWREARLLRLAPVSQEMTLNFIAHHGLGLPRSY